MKLSSTVARLFLKVVVSTSLLIFLFSKISAESLLVHLHSMNRATIAVGILVFFASNLIGSFQWHLLLTASGVRLAFLQSFRFYFVGLFFNNFLPANIGGDVVKVHNVTRIGSSVYQVIAVTLLDRLLGIFSLCLLATGAVIGVMRFSPIDFLGIYFIIFVGCMAAPLGFYYCEPLSCRLRRLVASIRPLSLDKRGSSILDYMGEFKSRRLFVARLVLLSVVIQFLRVLTHVLVALGLGVHVDPAVFGLFFVFVPLLSLAMIPPITVNGLGVREGLGILLFAGAGIGRTDAFAIEFLTYIVSVLVSLLGVIFFLARPKSRDKASFDTVHI
ncbi:MAG: flippase-like domain-containing protein [Candidatus Krumholzibacteria bacterium]|nr:flippase-like domain-containing protein [Candidatus Krumholzibacteria bacterium]